MEIKRGVIGDTDPGYIDTISSPTTVYVYNNVQETEVIDPFTKETHTEYVYDVTMYTPAEYAIEVASQAQADADYAIMLTEG